MTTERVRVGPDAFAALAGLAVPAAGAPGYRGAAPAAPAAAGPALAARTGRHGAAVLAGAAVVVAIAGALVVPGLVAGPPADRASVAVLDAPQQPADRLYPEDVTRLAVEAGSTRLLLVTGDGAHYAARTPSGELCLVRVAAGEVATEVCVPDRVGADATIGAPGSRQVRLVADGAPAPSGSEGWRPAGANVWVRG